MLSSHLTIQVYIKTASKILTELSTVPQMKSQILQLHKLY